MALAPCCGARNHIVASPIAFSQCATRSPNRALQQVYTSRDTEGLQRRLALTCGRLERVPTRYGLVATLTCSALALLSLFLRLSPAAGSLLYAAVLGLASGAHAAIRTIVWPNYFGIESLGALKGVVQAAMSGATALGPPVAAMLVAATGSFRSVILVFASLCGAAALVSLTLRKPTEPLSTT